MNSKKIEKYRKEYQIGTKLYHCASCKYLEYKIIGIRETANTIEFEIECQNCNDHNPCRVLIQPNDYDKLVYICMLNNDDEEEFGTDHQYIWHTTNEGYTYHKNINNARVEFYKEFKIKKQKELEQAEKQIQEIKKWITKADFDIANIINSKEEEK